MCLDHHMMEYPRAMKGALHMASRVSALRNWYRAAYTYLITYRDRRPGEPNPVWKGGASLTTSEQFWHLVLMVQALTAYGLRADVVYRHGSFQLR